MHTMRKLGTSKTVRLVTPIDAEDRDKFLAQYGKGGMGARVRDMVLADLDGRLTIKPEKAKGK